MGQRRILVIGSQCERLNRLAFLPSVAERLYVLMTDPVLGACVSALEGSGLRIDPTVDETYEAIGQAYARAAADEATLFIAYVGHGEMMGGEFYLLPRDSGLPIGSRTAVHLVHHIKELALATPGRIDGLGVLIDTCYSGVAGASAAQAWIAGVEGTLRFEVLTASSNLPAADACFTQALIKLLTTGIAAVPTAHLYCRDLRPRIEQACRHQAPQHPSYNPDDTLWLARNRGHAPEPWANTRLAETIERLMLDFQPTGALLSIAAKLETDRCVAVIGCAGSGKSTIAAALAWPTATEGMIVPGFIQATALLNESTSPLELSQLLAGQLAISLNGFADAQKEFKRGLRPDEFIKLSTLERDIAEPLKRLAPSRARLVIDGLDRMSPAAAPAIMGALAALAQLDCVRLLVTARPDTVLPGAAAAFSLAPPTAAELLAYLDRREVPAQRRSEVQAAANGNWLVARVLADLLREDAGIDLRAISLSLADAYHEMLFRLGESSHIAASHVLAILAAAGTGPILPLALLCAAHANMGGEDSAAAARDELVRLRGLAVRSGAGTDGELAGLFHQTLVDYVRARDPDMNQRAHRALIAAIGALAPPVPADAPPSACCIQYAFEREAEHYWAIGDMAAAMRSLRVRNSAVPKDNLLRFQHWEARLTDALGTDHPHTLETRSNSAFETGACGKIKDALRLYGALLPDIVKRFGPDSPDTLAPRHNIALLTWQSGDQAAGFQQMQGVAADRQRVLGAGHPDTLTSRNVLASWVLGSDNPQSAIPLMQAILRDRASRLGAEHIDTLTTRNNLVSALASLGDIHGAQAEATLLLPVLTRVAGPRHPLTLKCRATVTAIAGASHPHDALMPLEDICKCQLDVLGEDHPDVLATRREIGRFTALCGKPLNALTMLESVLQGYERIFGAMHPETLRVRCSIGEALMLTDQKKALAHFSALLPDLESVLGRSHPDTLPARLWLVMLMLGKNPQLARTLIGPLIADHERVLGVTHPGTQAARQLQQGMFNRR